MRLGRMELWSRLGRLTLVEKMLDDASTYREQIEWREHLQRAPHGVPWWGSFHMSRFPGDDERACERALVYDLLGIPEVEPFSQMLRGTMIEGQACEDWRVEELDIDGRLLSPPLGSKHQLRMEDADHWLAGATDVVVLPPFTNRPHMIETKTKDLDIVIEMKDAKKSYDAKQMRQARAHVAIGSRVAHKLWPRVAVCRHTWRLAEAGNKKVLDSMICRDHGINADSGCLIVIDLHPMQSGTLLYMGRDRPHVKVGYFFEHDEEWFQKGLAVLARARAHVEEGTLPAHPFAGKNWSEQPCRFCGQKREACKPDHKAGIARLVDSNAIGWATKVYGHYDVERIMRETIERWSGRSGYRGVLPDDYHLAASVGLKLDNEERSEYGRAYG